MNLEDVILRDDRASQPAANTVPSGTLYCVTDEDNIIERSTGAAWEAYSPTPSLPKSISVLTSGTGATYTVPAGIFAIIVEVQGAGGGGGGADGGSSQSGVGAGGGGGGYCRKVYAVTPGQTFLYTIGTGGAGGVAGNNAGTAGGTTTFDNGGAIVTVLGGTGGGSMAAGTTLVFASGGIGQLPTGGDFNTRAGTRANIAVRSSGTVAFPSAGGNSMLGAGGGIGGTDAAGVVGQPYGGGGSGAHSSTITDRAGGAGADGVIIVTEFGF